MEPMTQLKAIAIAGVLMLGAGIGWWVHPGAGVAVIGLVLWIDLTLASMHR